MDRHTDLALHWEDLRRHGERANADELCPDDSVLRQKLAETIDLLEAYESLMKSGGSSVPASHPIPEHIGKYKVRRVLGIGGMGVVYEGWDPILERKVAIKIIKPKGDPVAAQRAVQRFLREGKLQAKFRHKSIVTAHEGGDYDGSPYLVMDYFEGGNLAKHRERLTAAGPGEIAPLMEKVARAVQDAHDEDVLHRDLKPGNVLLDKKGNPFVADFGLASMLAPENAEGSKGSPAVDPGAVTITCAGGTPGYMAPEQYDLVSGAPGKPADVWALGVILFELLMGRKPFVDTARLTVYEQVIESPTPALPGIPKALGAIVHHCLEKDPAKRYQNAGELADDLHRFHQPTRRQAIRLGAAATLAAGAGLAWWATRPPRKNTVPPPESEFEGYTDPRAVQEALTKLERGESVTLIDRGQPLPGYQLAIGPASGIVLSGPEYTFGVQPNGYCVVMLLPRLPPGEWVIEARLRHAVAPGGGSVGLAAGITRAKGPGGWVAQAYTLGFGKPGADTTAVPSVLVARETGPQPFNGNDNLIGLPKPVPPEANDPPDLRRLEVLVSEKTIAGRMGRVKFPTVQVDRFTAMRDSLLSERPLPPGSDIPVTNLLGGIGVYANFGVLDVQILTVRPKPPAP